MTAQKNNWEELPDKKKKLKVSESLLLESYFWRSLVSRMALQQGLGYQMHLYFYWFSQKNYNNHHPIKQLKYIQHNILYFHCAVTLVLKCHNFLLSLKGWRMISSVLGKKCFSSSRGTRFRQWLYWVSWEQCQSFIYIFFSFLHNLSTLLFLLLPLVIWHA